MLILQCGIWRVSLQSDYDSVANAKTFLCYCIETWILLELDPLSLGVRMGLHLLQRTFQFLEVGPIVDGMERPCRIIVARKPISLGCLSAVRYQINSKE